MKKNIIIIATVLILPILAYWMLNVSNTTNAKNSQLTGKPQVIKFTSKMCLDCQTMNRIMKEIYPKYENNIVLTEINVQDDSSFNDSMIEEYKVTLVPTIILLNSDGTQAKRIEGAIPKDEMEKCLQGLK